jgi:hypothetical protein
LLLKFAPHFAERLPYDVLRKHQRKATNIFLQKKLIKMTKQNQLLNLLFFSSFLFLGCSIDDATNQKLTKEILCNTWQMSHIDDSEAKSGNNSLDLLMSSALVKDMQDGVSYAFFKDGQYGEAIGSSYSCGKWTFSPNAKQISLFDQDGKETILSVDSYNQKDKVLIINVKDSKIKLSYKQLEPLKDETINILYSAHNAWRKKATKHESDEELLDRLENLVQHYIYLLETAQQRKGNVVSFVHSKSIIKIYNGGIGVLPQNQIDAAWKDIFFDVENEERIYQLFEESLEKGGDLNVQSTGNWVTDDIMVLKAIYANFSHKIQM